jgi:hypothetical protein
MTQNTVQSSYSRYQSAGVAGAFADMSGWDADSLICESASIGFGLAVSAGTADNGAVLGGATFRGISVRDITVVHSTADRYEQHDNMAAAVRGDIWVLTATAVVNRKQAYYNSSTGEIGGSGISNAVAIAGAVFLDTAGSGAMARVRLSNTVGDITT